VDPKEKVKFSNTLIVMTKNELSFRFYTTDPLYHAISRQPLGLKI
jgi:hypothetical protein